MTGWRAGLACLAGLALAGLAFWLGRATAPEIAPPAPVSPAGSEQLRGELELQRERGRELAAQVAWLQGQMTRLGQEAAPDPADPSEPEAPGAGEAAAPEGDRPPRWFDAQQLLDQGMAEGDVARLRATFDTYEMERIELQHQAEREGWLNKPRFWNEMVRFQLGLREEIGDESYDLMLYATGRKNRVVMGELLGGSPAEQYGFEAGDVVVSYDGKRIFHGPELRRATAQGERGDWVTIDVLRGGEVVRVRARRGPLGVKLRPARILPETLW